MEVILRQELHREVFGKTDKQLETECIEHQKHLPKLITMTIEKLSLDNYNNFGSGVEIDYSTTTGILQVCGDTNVGKTSCIIESMLYVLYDTQSRNYDNVNSHNRKMQVTLELESNVKRYIIERGGQFKDKNRTPKNYMTSIRITENGKRLAETNIKKIREKTRELFGTQEDIEAVSIISRESILFNKQSDILRKKLLSRIFTIEEYNAIYKTIRGIDSETEYSLYPKLVKGIIKEMNKLIPEYKLKVNIVADKISIYAEYETKRLEIRKLGYSESINFEIIFKIVVNHMNNVMRTNMLIIDIPEIDKTMIEKIRGKIDKIIIITNTELENVDKIINIKIGEDGNSYIPQ